MHDAGDVAVVGAGLIGCAWAIVFGRAGHRVALYDRDAAALAAAPARIDRALADLQSAGLLADSAAVRERIVLADDLRAALANAVHAQENIVEEVDAKRAIFEEMDALAPPHCVLASSSSFIPSSRFTETLPGRGRTLIAHPANPPHVIPIVEIVPAPWTEPGVVERTRALLAAAGQTPVLVERELPGFILNRLQAALLNEAFRLVADGYASSEDVDKTIRDGLGRRWAFMGPFETIDLNAPGGVVDYAQRYGESMYAMACEQAEPRRWMAETIERIGSERRAALPASEHAARQAWRDRMLMRLTKTLDEGKDD
ncbi:MAG: 3-hydroxyacyl-CoA dehydrogenase [Candidatus Velthaea sp.]